MRSNFHSPNVLPMHTLEMRALQECLREAESGEGETVQSVCYQLAMLQIFNGILFNMGCAEKKKS